MELKIWGKSLFEFKRGGKNAVFLDRAYNQIKESKFLPDFHVNFNNNYDSGIIAEYSFIPTSTGAALAVPNKKKNAKAPKPKVEKAKVEITPKGVYEMKTLNDESFKLNTDPKYVDAQIASFKDKLSLIKKEEYDMRNGTAEIGSVLARMENRKKYAEFKDFFDQFPYTTSAKITDLVKNEAHLKLGQIAQFMADMPAEAVEKMKNYTKETQKLCGKDAVYYIIANKKDFQKSEKRRDPILLAQSPFGHAWQILGAWDEEMLLLEEL